MMRTLDCIATVLTGLVLMTFAPRAQAQGFQVIANLAKPATSLNKGDVAKVFLKALGKWESGLVAAPCGNAASKAVTDAFARTVLGRSASALESYWQQQIFAGKDIPPPEKKSDEDVIAYVQATPGAIGYVAVGTTLGAGVKAVRVQ